MSTERKYWPDVAAFMAILTLCMWASTTAFASNRPTARQAAETMGKGFNLGQMFDNSQHPPTLDVARPKIDAYYARGFRTVRIPVTWTEAVGGTTLANPETGRIDRASPRLAELTAVIDYALAQPGLHVVINSHHESRLKDSGDAAVLAQLWTDISDLFGDHDGRLMFEILNEPHLSNKEPMPPETLREMTGRAYTVIRRTDPRRIVIIGGNQWFGAHEMALTWPDIDAVGGGSDPYVMATFHHYSPWEFSGDNQGDYADPWTDEDIASPMQIMADWASTTGGGMPIFIGEWGVGWGSRYEIMDCNNIRLWYTRFDSVHARRFGMPTAVWDDGGWFQVYDHDSDSFPNNLIDCIDGVCTLNSDERFKPKCD
ncbi:glycoside hydrolase family 5 protein [uncultured Brevundimonas sp.]|uniref:glycoside hydrolase family 5 protein n=1 Tax=uncultured Brevundimonas sp. TaxID=213418 RepID=UPI0025D58818|nr:glycoside hydrolase family 5 protein [uncultured Brevundimonas sp.]